MPREPSTPRTDTEETRRAILRAAERLFMEQGYRAVTTRQVAEASGVKQPALYYHFPDKETLFLEVLREHTLATRAAIERIAARHTESLPERLRQVIRYLRHSQQPNMAIYQQELRHEISPQGRVQASEMFRTCIVAPITAIFEEGVQSGVLRPPAASDWQPRMATFLLLSATANLATQGGHSTEPIWTSDGDPAATIAQMLIYGLVARPSGSQI